MNTKVFSFVAAVVLASCTSVSGPEVTTLLSDNPAVASGDFTTGGGVTIAVDIREKDGRTLVCGAWAQSKSQSVLTKGRARDVAAKGAVFLGREQITYDTTFIRVAEVEPSLDYAGSPAHCQLTKRPWQAGDDARPLTVTIPRHLVHREIENNGGGVIIYFRSGGRGAFDS